MTQCRKADDPLGHITGNDGAYDDDRCASKAAIIPASGWTAATDLLCWKTRNVVFAS